MYLYYPGEISESGAGMPEGMEKRLDAFIRYFRKKNVSFGRFYRLYKTKQGYNKNEKYNKIYTKVS